MMGCLRRTALVEWTELCSTRVFAWHLEADHNVKQNAVGRGYWMPVRPAFDPGWVGMVHADPWSTRVNMGCVMYEPWVVNSAPKSRSLGRTSVRS